MVGNTSSVAVEWVSAYEFNKAENAGALTPFAFNFNVDNQSAQRYPGFSWLANLANDSKMLMRLVSCRRSGWRRIVRAVRFGRYLVVSGFDRIPSRNQAIWDGMISRCRRTGKSK